MKMLTIGKFKMVADVKISLFLSSQVQSVWTEAKLLRPSV